MTTVTELKDQNAKIIKNLKENHYDKDLNDFIEHVLVEFAKLKITEQPKEHRNMITNSRSREESISRLRGAMHIAEEELFNKLLRETSIGVLMNTVIGGAFQSQHLIDNTIIKIEKTDEGRYSISNSQGSAKTGIKDATKLQIINDLNNDVLQYTLFYDKFIEALQQTDIIPKKHSQRSSNKLVNILNYFSEDHVNDAIIRGINIQLTDNNQVEVINSSKNSTVKEYFLIEDFLKLSKNTDLKETLYYQPFSAILEQLNLTINNALINQETKISNIHRKVIKRRRIPQIKNVRKI